MNEMPATVVKHVSVKDDKIEDVLDKLPRANVTTVD